MRILTYNLHGWQGTDGRIDVGRTARIIGASGADVVALNEVYHPMAAPGSDRAALDLLAEALGMEAAFGVANTPALAFGPRASFGNALLTRLPLLAHAGHHLAPVEGHEQRGMLEARLLLPNGRDTLTVYVTHLDHLSEAVRLQQLVSLLSWAVRDRSRPHLLVGDFNALAPADFRDRPAAMEALRADARLGRYVADALQVVPRLLRARYADAGAEAGDMAATFPAHAPSARVDYVFVSQSLAPALTRCEPWQTEETAVASDHLPLLAEFDLVAMGPAGEETVASGQDGGGPRPLVRAGCCQDSPWEPHHTPLGPQSAAQAREAGAARVLNAMVPRKTEKPAPHAP